MFLFVFLLFSYYIPFPLSRFSVPKLSKSTASNDISGGCSVASQGTYDATWSPGFAFIPPPKAVKEASLEAWFNIDKAFTIYCTQ